MVPLPTSEAFFGFFPQDQTVQTETHTEMEREIIVLVIRLASPLPVVT